MGLVAHLRAWARGLMSLMSSLGSSSGRILAGGGGGDGTAGTAINKVAISMAKYLAAYEFVDLLIYSFCYQYNVFK